MHILITGVGGLIGSNFADYIINTNKDVKIVGIDDLSGGYKENINSEVIFYQINLQNYDSVEQIFIDYKFDYIFHFAAYAAEGLSPFIRKFNYNNNLLTTVNLINMAVKYKIKRFIFTSSMAVYGNGKVPFDEKDTPKPYDPYGIAKYACEMDLQVAKNQHNLDFCIIRPHNVYGNKQNIWDKYRNVLGIWIYQYLNNQPLTIYGDGEQTRAFTHIDDILPCLWKSAILETSRCKIINLGGIHSIKLNEAKDIFLEIIKNKDYPVKYLTERHEVKHAWSTYQKSVYILDFKHQKELKDGLKQMLEWAKTQPNREVKKWGKYELEENIYEQWI
jgi:UDP-glucose 4-epimerase